MNTDLTAEPENKPACIKCGNTDILEGYPNKLCAGCRSSLIKFPIPLWVKLFGAGIVLIMMISAIWLPRNFKAAIALSKAEKAENELNYAIEQQELEKAKAIIPQSVDVNAHLVIASFYNEDFKTLITSVRDIGSNEINDSSVYNKVTNVLNHYKECFPSDTFNVAFSKYKTSPIPDTAYQEYIKKNPLDVYSIYSLADSYNSEKKYHSADSLLSVCLNIDPLFLPALGFKTSVKRALNQTDSSLYYCDKMLQLNHQSVYALSSKARTYLKGGNDKLGLKFAYNGYLIDNQMTYNLATLAIAYHMNKDFKKRDEIINAAQKDSLSQSYIQFARDVISNKDKL